MKPKDPEPDQQRLFPDNRSAGGVPTPPSPQQHRHLPSVWMGTGV